MDKKNILERVNHDSGMRVPEGYFADFESRLKAQLPEQPWENASEPQPVKMSPWMRLRPYIYMAAMFAGIWLMMHMFSLFTPPSIEGRFASNQVLAQAVQSEQVVDAVTADSPGLHSDEIDDMLDEMYDEGVSVDELRMALNQQLDNSPTL